MEDLACGGGHGSPERGRSKLHGAGCGFAGCGKRSLVEFGTPNLPMRTHNERYNWLDNYPAPPVPYGTFDAENSYGPKGHPDYEEVE